MADLKLPMRGDNVSVVALVNNRPHDQADNCKSVNVEPKHTVHEDKLLGRARDRLDQQLRGWKAEFEFEHTDNVLFKAWLEVQRAREERRPIPEIVFAITFDMRDGTSETWALQKCVATPKKNSGGSEDVSMMSWSVVAEEYVKTL